MHAMSTFRAFSTVQAGGKEGGDYLVARKLVHEAEPSFASTQTNNDRQQTRQDRGNVDSLEHRYD